MIDPRTRWIIGLNAFSFTSNLLATSWWLPVDRSVHGMGIDALFGWIFWTCVATFVLVHILLVITLYKFRQRDGKRAVHSHGNGRVEIIWTAIPALILIGMTVASARVARSSAFVGAPEPDAPVCQRFVVIGQQFKWNVIGAGTDGKLGHYGVYPKPTDARWPVGPEGAPVTFRGVPGPAFLPGDETAEALNAYIEQVNPLGKLFDPDLDPEGFDDDWRGALGRPMVVNVNQPVEIKLMSRDVIHGFFLPDFRVKLDAIPGRVNTIRFTPTAPGAYDIVCSQFCGLGHAAMGGKLVVLDSPGKK